MSFNILSTSGSSGGGGSIAGSNKNIQFNSSGSFAGTNDFNWDNANKALTLSKDSQIEILDFAPSLAFDTLLAGGSLTADHQYFYCITKVDVFGNETIASNVVSATPTGATLKVRMYKLNFSVGSGAYLNVYRSDSASFGATSFLFAVADGDQPTYIIDDGTVSLTTGTPPATTSMEYIRFGLPVSQNKIANWVGRMGMLSDTDGLWYLIHNQYYGNARWDRDFALASGYDGTWLNAPTGLSVHIGVDGREGTSSPGAVLTVAGNGVNIGANIAASTSTVFTVENGAAYLKDTVNSEVINIIQNYNAGAAAIGSLYFYNNSGETLAIRNYGGGFSSSGYQQANGASIESPGKLAIVSVNDNPITMYANNTLKFSVASTAVTSAVKLDLSGIAASGSNMVITATSDTPTTTYTAHVASTDPAGYMKITVGGNSRYLPFYT